MAPGIASDAPSGPLRRAAPSIAITHSVGASRAAPSGLAHRDPPANSLRSTPLLGCDQQQTRRRRPSGTLKVVVEHHRIEIRAEPPLDKLYAVDHAGVATANREPRERFRHHTASSRRPSFLERARSARRRSGIARSLRAFCVRPHPLLTIATS